MIKADMKKEPEVERKNEIMWLLIPLFVFIGIFVIITVVSLISWKTLQRVRNHYHKTLILKEEAEKKHREYCRLKDYKERVAEEIEFLKETKETSTQKLDALRMMIYRVPSRVKVKEATLKEDIIKVRLNTRNKLLLEKYLKNIEECGRIEKVSRGRFETEIEIKIGRAE